MHVAICVFQTSWSHGGVCCRREATSTLLAELQADDCLETQQQGKLAKLTEFIPSGLMELKYQGDKEISFCNILTLTWKIMHVLRVPIRRQTQ